MNNGGIFQMPNPVRSSIDNIGIKQVNLGQAHPYGNQQQPVIDYGKVEQQPGGYNNPNIQLPQPPVYNGVNYMNQNQQIPMGVHNISGYNDVNGPILPDMKNCQSQNHYQPLDQCGNQPK